MDEARRKYLEKYREEHREQIRAQQKAWYDRTHEKRCVYRRELRLKNLEETRKRGRQYYYDNREAMLAKRRKWFYEHREKENTKQRVAAQLLRLQCLITYGGNPPRCACCGETHPEFLSLDHMNGGGRQHRLKLHGGGRAIYYFLKREGFPLGYRVLCVNCNTAIGLYGYCPHQRVKENG